MPEKQTGAIEVTDADFENKISQAKAVVVDCYATWCGPCRVLSPIIDELAEEFAGKVSVYKLDVDKEPKTANHYGIMSIPTVLYFKDGKLADQSVGVLPKPTLANKVQNLIDKE